MVSLAMGDRRERGIALSGPRVRNTLPIGDETLAVQSLCVGGFLDEGKSHFWTHGVATPVFGPLAVRSPSFKNAL